MKRILHTNPSNNALQEDAKIHAQLIAWEILSDDPHSDVQQLSSLIVGELEELGFLNHTPNQYVIHQINSIIQNVIKQVSERS